jgi:hypothetical protein
MASKVSSAASSEELCGDSERVKSATLEHRTLSASSEASLVIGTAEEEEE